MALRTIDLFDLALPVGTEVTRDMRGIQTEPEHRVVQGRMLDARPRRTWRFERDDVGEIELKRFRELCSSSSRSMPVDLWMARRNGMIFTGEIARGAANGSAHYGWSKLTANTAVTGTATVVPFGSGTAAELATDGSATAEAEILQEIGRAPRREGRSITCSVYAFESTAPDLRLRIADEDAFTWAGATFAWSAGVLTVAASDAGITASVDDTYSGAGWYRAVVTADLEVVPIEPVSVLGVRIAAPITGPFPSLAVELWGAQLVLGESALEYQAVGPDRVQPAPVFIREPRIERQNAVRSRVAASLVEMVD